MAEKKPVKEQTESLIENRQTYQIIVGGTVDSVNTRDPIGYSAYDQGWENNQWVNKSMDVRRGKTNKNAPGRMRAFNVTPPSEVNLSALDMRLFRH